MKGCNEVSELLYLYMENQLDKQMNSELEEHLDSCEKCRAELEQIKNVMLLCKDIGDEELPVNFKSDLHEKLLKAKAEEDNRGKVIKLRTRYLRIGSAIAAGFIVVLMTYGLFKGSWGLTTNDNGAAAPDTDINSMMIAGEANQKSSADGYESKVFKRSSNEDSSANPQMSALSPETDDTVENKAHDLLGDMTMSRAGAGMFSIEYSVSDEFNIANYIINSEMPGEQMDVIGSIADRNSAVLQQYGNEPAAGDGLEAADDSSIILSYLIPVENVKSFENELVASFGEGNIEVEDTEQKELYLAEKKELAAQMDDITKRIGELKADSKVSNPDELKELEQEKQILSERIRLHEAVATSIAVTIKAR